MGKPKIVQLEQHVADLIAAGEVVSRPASVVKELLENSIDAGAGIITVEIEGGGMTYIRVTDNGYGIAPEYVKTAFLRHATSKLQDAKDLEAIETLGFRGEALAAIAAVSRIELITREASANEGVRLLLDAGIPVSTNLVGCPVGTSIVVRDLFFNTPARLKFMKTDRAEGSAVSSAVLRIALSRPDISFRFIKDGKTEYHSPGDTRIDSCVYSLLGRDMIAGFKSIESTEEAVSVKGYISNPDASRGSRGYQFFFVNNRTIRSLVLQSALEQAYKNSLGAGRFPACVLYITTEANNVDVNVHPAKTEVKFVSDKQVFDCVYYAVLGALEQMRSSTVHSDGAGIAAEKQDSEAAMPGKHEYYQNLHAAEYQKTHIGKKNISNKYKTPIYPSAFSVSEPSHQRTSYANSTQSHTSQLPYQETPVITAPFRIIGEAFNVYIIVEHQDSVYFIDKHAAHERVYFNMLKNREYKPMSETLISPIICRFDSEDVSLLLDNAEIFYSLGFSVERFGEDAVAVRHIPADIDIRDTESCLSEICSQLKQGGTPDTLDLEGINKTVACKASIKAGSSSDIRELEMLTERVLSGEITHCPHGRPVMFELSKTTLEKRFGRT